MSTLNVIGEFLDNWEQAALKLAARDLVTALADTAPRGCSSALLLANNTPVPELEHPKTRVEVMPLHTGMLPVVWRTGTAARPLDGDFVHTLTPLVPLRSRTEDDGSQSSVTVPHTLAWDAPDLLPKGQAKTLRQYVRRALKYADVIVTPTHAVADRLRAIYGDEIRVQVVPLAPPTEYLPADTDAEVRTRLGLPDDYLLTNAYPGDIGRLEWALRAMEVHAELPPLVIVGRGSEADLSQWSVLGDRLIQLRDVDVTDRGAVISGARAFVYPQAITDCLFPLHGALAASVPVIHGSASCASELVLDGGVAATDETEFADALSNIVGDTEERQRIALLANDRSRMYSWHTAAWQLWELHANI